MSDRMLIAAMASLAVTLSFGPATPSAALPTRACVESTDRLADFALRPADPAIIEQSIRWTERGSSEAGKLMEAYDLSGECAAVVAGFVMGVGALETGESFAIRSGTLTRQENAVETMIEPDPVEGDPPVLPGGWFVMAAEVNGQPPGGRGESDYLGLWQTDEGSIVATFVRSDGRTVGRVEPLFRSSLPLTSIAYFPAPDTQAGRIGVVQQAGPGVARLIGYDWYHPDAFRTPAEPAEGAKP
jgi:hypothetical protein